MSINYLAKKNKTKRDNNISFQEEGHKYKVNGETDYTSVTTYIHTLGESFNENQVIKKMKKSKNWENSKYFGKSDEEIKKIWSDNRIFAATAGTKMHYDIECKYNGLDVSNDSPEFKHFMNFYNDYKNLIPYRTEMLIYKEEVKLSGSVDMIFCNENGEYEIYDWKRSREINKNSKFNKWLNHHVVDHLPDTNYWHYALQLNIYKAILVEKYNMNITNLYLVVLHPEHSDYLRIPIPDLQNEVRMLFQDRYNKLNNLKVN